MLEDEDNAKWDGEQEDWSDNFNDMGSDFWEDHYASAERGEELEKEYLKSIEEDAAQEGIIEAYLERIIVTFSRLPEKEKRRCSIVSWLRSSKFANNIDRCIGSGCSFYISGSSSAKLKNGRVVNIKDWLCEEGIKEGLIVSDPDFHYYKIHYDVKENRLYFSRF